ncbi:GNAT family N-acetyltransferase [Desulfitobacterium sp. THU1]|uniref:GNAT family N-acetyltransferase n=1 Tax=Desulfitobacterium sp. THU1 TaxID=3138072 RepID=UPI00311EB9D5
MEFRRAAFADINSIMKIIEQAQAYFKEAGINQWQNNYPNAEIIAEDIDNNHSYVLVNDGNVVATAAVSFDGEATYDIIYQGQWLSDHDYAVIHRLAVDDVYKGQGVSSLVINSVEQLCRNRGVESIKVDTHEGNIAMQKLLRKNKFQYCGIIYLKDGNKRIAFEKILSPDNT